MGFFTIALFLVHTAEKNLSRFLSDYSMRGLDTRHPSRSYRSAHACSVRNDCRN